MPDASRKPSAETRGHQHAPADLSEESTPLHTPSDESYPLTRDTLAAYNQSHNRLLIGLTLLLAFLLSCFAISDPDIFFSLATGRLIAHGEFPWGQDPYGYAAGEHATWVHPGWLGDLAIYGLFEWGGGPLLVLTRAAMMVVLFYLLFQLGARGPRRFLTVLAGALGVVALSQRFYFRTELFSYFLLGLTFWSLAARPGAGWLTRLNRLTAGRPYWLLPLVILLWVNLDAWFFLGVLTVIVWAVVHLLNPAPDAAPGEGRSLAIVAALCVAASLCNPYHVNVWRTLPTQVFPPTGTELLARYAENQQLLRQQSSAASSSKAPVPQRVPEQTRFFVSPWDVGYFHPVRQVEIANLAVQDPLLPLVTPMGMSLSEWAYYPLVVLAVLSFLAPGAWRRWERLLLFVAFLALSASQSRFMGFFAVAGTALAILNFQYAGSRLPSLSRFRIVFGQFARLGLGLALQILSLLQLVPSPDALPSPYGHVHGRGHFGFAYRVDPGLRGVVEQLGRWEQAGQLPGRTFLLDWVEQPAYDVWFHPGGRHFFDRRYAVHSEETTKAYFAAADGLNRITLDRIQLERLTPEKLIERRQVWQNLFRQYDISHIVVRRRHDVRYTSDVLPFLLAERDEHGHAVWKPLQQHDGTYFVLAWTGSPHWSKVQALQFDPGQTAFRTPRSVGATADDRPEGATLGSYLRGDAPRRPSGVDEAAWYSLISQIDPELQAAAQILPVLARMEISGGLIARFAADLATPAFEPPIPLLMSTRQMSASTLLLSLQSARRGVAQLTPDSSPSQRADAWMEYYQAATSMTEYEAAFAPNARLFRDPLNLFVLRQATAACDAVGRPTHLLHLTLAHTFYGRRAFDVAFEQYQDARAVLERLAARDERAQRILQQLPAFVKQQDGYDPAVLEADFKRQQGGWQEELVRAGVPLTDGTPREALARAGLALRFGLPGKALEELNRYGTPTPETYLMACQVCMALGQYDVQTRDYLLPHPELRAAFEPGEYEYRISLGWWCLGRPDLAAVARKDRAELYDLQAREGLLLAESDLLFGTSPHRWGSTYLATVQAQRAAGMSLTVAENRVAEGLLRLEAGQPSAAAEVFREVIHAIEPDTSWRPLLARYYLQITGKTIDETAGRAK